MAAAASLVFKRKGRLPTLFGPPFVLCSFGGRIFPSSELCVAAFREADVVLDESEDNSGERNAQSCNGEHQGNPKRRSSRSGCLSLQIADTQQLTRRR